MSLPIPAILAFLAIGIRLVAYYNGYAINGEHFMLIHLGLVLGAVFFAINEQARSGSLDFVNLIRAGMRGAGIYALITAAFIWIFYTYIDTTFFAERIEQLVNSAADSEHNKEEARGKFEQFFTPFNYTTISFVGLLMLGALNSIILTLLHTKVLPKLRR